jgi:hypothetical protein
MHELGHALGLKHTGAAKDLMYESADLWKSPASSVYPSTLDLYAVSVLTNSRSLPGKVTLPDNIPYELYPVNIQLSVKGPNNVPIKVDGITYSPGTTQMTLTAGEHIVEIPATFQIDEGTRLKFMKWQQYPYLATVQDSPNLDLQLVVDTSLEAIYVTQYRVVVKDITNKSLSERWYDGGTIAGFAPPTAVKDSVAMEGILGVLGGKWRLSGWLDNGKPVSPNTNIIVNQPHTITPKYDADYLIPILVMGVISAGVATTFMVYRRRRLPGKTQDPTGNNMPSGTLCSVQDWR